MVPLGAVARPLVHASCGPTRPRGSESAGQSGGYIEHPSDHPAKPKLWLRRWRRQVSRGRGEALRVRGGDPGFWMDSGAFTEVGDVEGGGV